MGENYCKTLLYIRVALAVCSLEFQIRSTYLSVYVTLLYLSLVFFLFIRFYKLGFVLVWIRNSYIRLVLIIDGNSAAHA